MIGEHIALTLFCVLYAYSRLLRQRIPQNNEFATLEQRRKLGNQTRHKINLLLVSHRCRIVQVHAQSHYIEPSRGATSTPRPVYLWLEYCGVLCIAPSFRVYLFWKNSAVNVICVLPHNDYGDIKISLQCAGSSEPQKLLFSAALTTYTLWLVELQLFQFKDKISVEHILAHQTHNPASKANGNGPIKIRRFKRILVVVALYTEHGNTL